LWQRFNIADFDISGFEYVPTTSTGAYNGDLLMGTYPKSYDAKTAYAKVSWSF
ncbi:hypothetical protein HZB08_03360, partial [Candidatus Saganbacteria bacterium]|nr:hypothetical protein [Candidatus Saganbacteria bacterium]